MATNDKLIATGSEKVKKVKKNRSLFWISEGQRRKRSS